MRNTHRQLCSHAGILLGAALLALPFAAVPASAADEPAEAPHVEKRVVIVRQDGAGLPDPTGAEAGLHSRTIERDGRTIILRTSKPLTDAEAQAEADRAFAALPPVPPSAPDSPTRQERRISIVTTDSNGPSIEASVAGAPACEEGARQIRADASEDKGDGQRQTVRIRTCVAAGDSAAAIAGIRRIRERIAADGNMSAGIKAQVLQQLDAEIERLSKQG